MKDSPALIWGFAGEPLERGRGLDELGSPPPARALMRTMTWVPRPVAALVGCNSQNQHDGRLPGVQPGT